MIELFKILRGSDELGFKTMFQMNYNTTRGHKFKLQKQNVRTLQRKCFYSQRVIDSWNSLPNDVVDSPSLHVFKKRLDPHFEGKGKIYSYS